MGRFAEFPLFDCGPHGRIWGRIWKEKKEKRRDKGTGRKPDNVECLSRGLVEKEASCLVCTCN